MENEVNFLQFVVENLVNNKEDISIERIEDELGVLLTLRVNKDDMWIIIWRNGNTVNALRSIIKILGLKSQKRINLKVLD